MITLFESTSTEFTTNGLGSLPDAASCFVTEERNGEFELEMEYPITGLHYDELSLRRLIVAKPNPYDDPQAFRIYLITKPINGLVTVNAEHISYDLSGYPVSPFTANSVGTALSTMEYSCIVTCPFTFTTDKATSATMTVTMPASIRSLLGGTEGSLLDVYGGEYKFDNFNVQLLSSRGSNRGVSIRYGKNLTDLEQEENCSSVYTGVYPFWYSEDDGLVELSDKYVEVDGTFDFVRIYPLDLSDEWTEAPTESQLRAKAESYISDNDIGVPKVSLTVSFVSLAQSEEYANYALLETVYLCDTVNVEFPDLGVSATSKCIKTKYNVLTGKYEEIELGESRTNLASTIVSQTSSLNEKVSSQKTYLQQAIDNATQLITGGLGGYVIIHSSSGDGYPDEILIMDTDDIETATKVWRWNKNGFGYSSTGYNGEYATAITMDGSIVANFITSGYMSANYIWLGGEMTVYQYDTEDNTTIGGYIGFLNGSTGVEDTDGIGIMDATRCHYLLASDAGVGIFGKADSTGDITASIYVLGGSGRVIANGNATFNDDLTVSGATTLRSTLTVSGATTLSSTLEVTGDAYFYGAVTVDTLTIDTLAVTNKISLGETLEGYECYIEGAAGSSAFLTACLGYVYITDILYFKQGSTYGSINYLGQAEFRRLRMTDTSSGIQLKCGAVIYSAIASDSDYYPLFYTDSTYDYLYIGHTSGITAMQIYCGGTIYLRPANRYVTIQSDDVSSDWTAGNSFNLCFPTSSTTYGAFVYVNSSGFYLGRSAFATYVYGSSVNVTGSLIVSSTDIYSGLSTSTTEQRLQVRNSYVRGYLYANTSGNLGIYNATLSAVMILQSAAGALTVGNTMYATYIYGTTVTIQASPFTVLGNMRIGSSSNATNYYLYLTNSSYELRLGCTTGGDRGLYDVTNSHWIVQNTSAGASYLGYSGYNTYLRGSTVYSSVSITVSSDRSLKTNIESLPDSYEAMLDAMEPVQFAMTEDESGKLHMGYIANDILTAAENAGLAESDIAWIMRGDDDLLGLNYSEIIPLLHLKIKKLEARIAQLESA